MNKYELSKEVAKKNEITIDLAYDVISTAMDVISHEVVKGNNVKLKGFGTFKKQTLKERSGTKPKTKEPILIPSRDTIKFVTSKTLKEELNK